MTTIQSILSLVKTRLRITNTDEDLGLLDLINETIRTFDCFETYVRKRCPLKREERGGYCLPEDYYQYLIVEGICNPFVGASDLPPNGVYPLNPVPFLYYNEGRLREAGFNGHFPGSYQMATVRIDGCRLFVSGAFNGIEGVMLTYEAYNTDEYGRFNAPKDFDLAVAERIMVEYMHDHRKNYAADTIQYHQRRADALYSQVKAKSFIRDFRRNYAQILDISNAILMDKSPNGGYGDNY